jgi:TIR domain
MPDVFISYPHEAFREASLLANALQTRGITNWIDSRDGSSSADWKGKVRDALQNAEAVVFVVTTGSEPSPWVRDEYMSALESYWAGKKKLLVPLLIEHGADAPGFLQQWQSVRIEKRSDWERAADKIAGWLRAYGTSRSEPTKKQCDAWRQRLRNIDKMAGELREVSISASKDEGVAPQKKTSSKTIVLD